jgi:hypothetical protein
VELEELVDVELEELVDVELEELDDEAPDVPLGGSTATVEPVVTTTSAACELGPCAMIAWPVRDDSTFSPIARSPGR